MSEHLSCEPFIEEHAISTEPSNVNREKHKLKSHRVRRRDREPSRIAIRSLKSLRNKSRKVMYQSITAKLKHPPDNPPSI